MNRFIPHPAPLTTVQGITVWLSALATLAVFSFLYKENRIYRIAEHLLLGLGIGFVVATNITDILIPKWWSPMAAGYRGGHWGAVAFGVVAGILGLMWYGLYFKKTLWFSRLVMAIVIGAGAGVAFKAEINDKLPQIVASFKPLYVPSSQATPFNNSVSNIIFLIILFSVLSYFFFSYERKHKVFTGAANAGRVFLMITFGVFFGNTIMTRMSVFIERIWFLLTQWLRVGGHS